MGYNLEINQSCKEEIQKYCKKNHILETTIKKKVSEIIENPQRFKPLRYGLSGERRVHIMKSFVFKYKIDEQRKTVILCFFGYHDEAYER
jgi:YafQ family addiction module toxin component